MAAPIGAAVQLATQAAWAGTASEASAASIVPRMIMIGSSHRAAPLPGASAWPRHIRSAGPWPERRAACALRATPAHRRARAPTTAVCAIDA